MGIDPISIVVAALAAGAAAAAKDTAAQTIKDAYAGLTGLLARRFAGRPEAAVALEQHAAAPQVWEAPLKDALEKTGAAQDASILDAARQLEALLKQHGGGPQALGTQSVAIGQAQDVASHGGAVVKPYFAGNVSNSGVAVAGRDVSGPVSGGSSGLAGSDVRALFEAVLDQVRARAGDPDVPNTEIQQKVENIRDEAAKGQGANATPIARWLGDLRSLAPDVHELVSQTLRGAGGAVSAAVRQVVEQSIGSGG